MTTGVRERTWRARVGACCAFVVVLLAGCGGRGTEPAVRATTDSGTWQLVWFSDSGAWGVASDWAQDVGRAVGKDVEVFDYIGYGSEGSADKVLERVTSNATIRHQIEGAEVVVVYASNYDVPVDYQRACLSMSSSKPPKPLTRKVLQPFRRKLTAIYDAVFALREGKPTIVRALDLYAPTVAAWWAAGTYRACNDGCKATAALQREVAASYGVPTASLYDAFNGPRHDQDPVAEGYIGPDGMHTTSEGKAVILETLAALGYAPVRR